MNIVQAVLGLNTPQFWSLMRTLLQAVSVLLAAMGITHIAGIEVAKFFDQTLLIFTTFVAIVAFIVVTVRGLMTKTGTGLAQEAVETDKAATLKRLAAEPDIGKMQVSNELARDVPSSKVVPVAVPPVAPQR